jgi:molecular chaperone HscB
VERTHKSSLPTRCTECQQVMETPVACSTCGSIGLIPPNTFDLFELFALDPVYDIDVKDLHRKYLAMSRVIHPDIAGGEGSEQRHQALTLSAELNRAYETLRDPIARASYMLSLAGGPSPSEMKAVPPSFLGEVLVMREEIEEARESGDAARLQSIRQEVSARKEETLDRIAELARGMECWETDIRRQLREQLNIMKYWNSLLEQTPADLSAPAASEQGKP